MRRYEGVNTVTVGSTSTQLARVRAGEVYEVYSGTAKSWVRIESTGAAVSAGAGCTPVPADGWILVHVVRDGSLDAIRDADAAADAAVTVARVACGPEAS